MRHLFRTEKRHVVIILLIAGELFSSGFMTQCLAQNITTVAGDGVYGYSGDGGPAVMAKLAAPIDVATDAAGNLYIADMGNNVIRKVDNNGLISTIAGTGTSGFSGDGGPAAAAELNSPQGISIDLNGNIFIVDFFNYRIRKITPSGTISTVAGNGSAGFAGDSGLAVSAKLLNPSRTVSDTNGNLYIADAGNGRIRKVNNLGIIQTIAGNGSSGFKGDGGQALSADLSDPRAVAFDSGGNMFIADFGHNRIRKVDPSGIITTIAGVGLQGNTGDSGPAISAELNNPISLVFSSSGNLFIGFSGSSNVRMINRSGIITTIAGNGLTGFSGDGGPATQAEFNYVSGITFDRNGTLYITDEENHRIRKVSGLVTGTDLSLQNSEKINVYPIPCKGRITAKVPGTGFLELSIFSVLGKLVYKENVSSVGDDSTLNINLEGIPSGIYYMSFVTNRSILNKRIEILNE